MRIAGRLASEVLDFITPHVKPGVTTGKLNDLCHDYMVREQGTTLAEKFALPASRYAAAGGAVPLRVTGAGVVGWMGVSGLPQVEDHRLVVRVLLEHLADVESA